MKRFIYQGVTQDGSGRVIASATVTVYLADGTTAATIYETETGAAASSNTVTSDSSDGSFVFWVDLDDYANAGRRFKVAISKTGYTTKTIDDVQIFPAPGYSKVAVPGPGAQTISASALAIGIVADDPLGNATWTTDTAAKIVETLPDVVVGSTLRVVFVNEATAASGEIVTLAGGSGVTLRGATLTLTEGTNEVTEVLFRVTNATASSEAVTGYVLQ